MKNFVKLASVLFFTATAAFAQTDTADSTTDVVVEQPATTDKVVRARVRVNTNDVYRDEKVVHNDAAIRRDAAATPRNNRVRRDRY